MAELGYLIGSHVVYQHRALPRLLESMLAVGIDPAAIVVNVNGSTRRHAVRMDGVWFQFVTGDEESHLRILVDSRCDYIQKTGIRHWLFLNCTSRCGPRFKELAEAGFDPDADATLAGAALPLGETGGNWGRAINDLAVYSADYLYSIPEATWNLWDTSEPGFRITDLEGYCFAHAPRQAAYPVLGYTLDRRRREDVYGTGVLRATEYYPGLDWYRYKKNFGQLGAGQYQLAEM